MLTVKVLGRMVINTAISSAGTTKTQRAVSYLTWAALAIALAGSVLSAFGICMGGCTEAARYRIFGMSFASLGVPFFTVAVAASLGRNSRSWELRCPYDAMLFGSAGAEVFFIGVQKTFIGHYCPICLTIAGAVYFAVAVRLAELFIRRRSVEAQGIRKIIAQLVHGGVVFCALFVGLISALVGTNTPTMATSGTITQDIWLGKTDSAIEVLFVSDWFCPYCRKTEPVVEKMLPKVGKVARYSFLDDPIHDASFNFMPYNMSLLLNSKDQYLEGRKALIEVAQQTSAPKESEIASAMRRRGVRFSLAEKAALMRLANSVGGFLKSNRVFITPSIVVMNHMTGERRVLTGADNIEEPKVLNAIEEVKRETS